MRADTASLYWTDPRLWREVNLSLSSSLKALGPKLEPARRMALRMETLLEFVIPVMEDLCQETCPDCSDPCCVRARAHFELADLLFLHLAGQALPLVQAGPEGHAACRHLGSEGCLLPRLSRPWICRWYLCPLQKSLVKHYPASGQRRFELALEQIRRLRRELEDTFIGILSH